MVQLDFTPRPALREWGPPSACRCPQALHCPWTVTRNRGGPFPKATSNHRQASWVQSWDEARETVPTPTHMLRCMQGGPDAMKLWGPRLGTITK